LLVEVAHTSQQYYQGIKAPLYARYGVRETWVVDVVRLSVEVFRDPSPEGYRRRQRCQLGEAVAAEAFPEESVEVCEIVGSLSVDGNVVA
jgi:Uma2 family endonuclease